ncbi:MAG: dehydrogenase [Actinobacteria bacterium]|nr:dehydrogenase [Actinomycetota bacterium]
MSDGLTETETDEFRSKVRSFLSENASAELARTLDGQRSYMGELAAAGLAGMTISTEYGGAGLTRHHDALFREEVANFPFMSSDFVISHGMCQPMLNDFGSEDQKKKYLPDNIAGRTLWCQMFSEPGAGSDVASLQTKAERDGDEFILNGQKVWTTMAHVSEYGVLIARTDPEAVKHAGISMFILKMDSPGVEIRPIHQIDGGKHFNEVFFSDVRVPVDDLLGEVNNGWNQATAMLMYERVAIGTIGAGKINQTNYRMLRSIAKESGKLQDPLVRQDLMKIYSMETAKSLVAMRTRAEMKAGKTPGPGGSLGKLFGSVIQWRMREIMMNMAGPASQAWTVGDDAAADMQRATVGSFSSSIAGGTDEIQRNIIGDRVLGLPRDISVDRGIPFKDLKVGTQR